MKITNIVLKKGNDCLSFLLLFSDFQLKELITISIKVAAANFDLKAKPKG